MSDGREGMPLKAEVKDGQLVIAIGIDTLTWAFEHNEDNNPYSEESGDYEQRHSICDKLLFANDVCHEINSEDDDGSSPLTRFLDSMMQLAANQGGELGNRGPRRGWG